MSTRSSGQDGRHQIVLIKVGQRACVSAGLSFVGVCDAIGPPLQVPDEPEPSHPDDEAPQSETGGGRRAKSLQ